MKFAIRTVVVVLAVAQASSSLGAVVNALRIMTFNVWSGEESAAGRGKLAEIIQASNADIIGVQELNNSAGISIAATLGFHYHQQSSGDIQVISRYPIVGQSTSNLGVQIELSPGQNIWLFNSHLAPYPYQPYDLRDGVLPKTESAVIAAANASRGSQVTTYLNDMAAALSSDLPVFFTGDFNEPSHLDWTAAAAAATPRPFDLKVEYPASKRIVDAGMTDSFRAVRPDEVDDPAYTWTPGYPYPSLASNEVHDRIDIIYHHGLGVTATSAATLGPLDGNASTDLGVAGYNADHRAVVASFALSPSLFLFGDLDADGELDIDDWAVLRSNQFADLTGLSLDDAWARGDLNGDLHNNHLDFTLFKRAFEAANGAGSFAALLAVPEPASWALAALAILVAARRRRRAV